MSQHATLRKPPRPAPHCRHDARSGALALGALVLIVSFVLPGGTAEGSPHIPVVPGQIMATGVHPFHVEGPMTTERRIPLLETFTATWCPPCGPADRAIDRLLEERSPGIGTRGEGGASDDPAEDRIDLAVLAYHPWPDPEGEDPYGTPEGHDRITSKYGAFWFPSTYVDGFLEEAAEDRSTAVDAGMEEVLYQSYAGLLEKAAAIPSGFRMTTDWRVSEGDVAVTVDLESVARLDGTFVVRGVLWEDHLRFAGSNGIDDHRMTVRALSAQQVLPPLQPGETWSGVFTLRIPEQVDLTRSGVVFFVEAAWGGDEGASAATLMGFAVGTAAVAAGVVFLMRRQMRRGPAVRQDRGPASRGQGPDEPAPSAAARSPNHTAARAPRPHPEEG